MKRSIYTLLTSILLLSAIPGCKKQADPTPDPTPAPPILLPKTISFAKTTIARDGDDVLHTLEYNDKNKLVKLTDVITNRRNTVSRIVEFLYDSSNKLSEIRTHGFPYFNYIGQIITLDSPYVSQKVVHSNQEISLLKATSTSTEPYTLASYNILFDSKGNITKYFESYYRNSTYIMNTGTDGNTYNYTYSDNVNNLTPQSFGPVYYNGVPSPFTNTPELRLFTLIREQHDYYRYNEDILLMNKFCPSAVDGGNLSDPKFAPSNTGYGYTLNSYGYPTSMKVTYNSQLIRQLDITYEVR